MSTPTAVASILEGLGYSYAVSSDKFTGDTDVFARGQRMPIARIKFNGQHLTVTHRWFTRDNGDIARFDINDPSSISNLAAKLAEFESRQRLEENQFKNQI